MRGLLPTILSAVVLAAAAVLGSGITSSSGGSTPSPRPVVEAPRTGIDDALASAGLPYLVCGGDAAWSRPAADVRRARLYADGRFAGLKAPDIESRLDASFWADYDGAVTLDGFTVFSGLRTPSGGAADVLAPALAGCNDYPSAVQRSLVNLWLLNHEVSGVTLRPSAVIVQVEPVRRGYQVVQVALPRGTTPAQVASFDFVDASGQTLARIDGAWYWSHAP